MNSERTESDVGILSLHLEFQLLMISAPLISVMTEMCVCIALMRWIKPMVLAVSFDRGEPASIQFSPFTVER